MPDPSRDPRRRFTQAERDAVYDRADGKCENLIKGVRCNAPLGPGWHCDHHFPHVLGGVTDIRNGRALCAPCNLRKGARVIDPRTTWQDRAETVWARHARGPNCLMEVVTGGGKTRIGCRCARKWLDEHPGGLVIICVPSTSLVDQWAEAAWKDYGLNVDKEWPSHRTNPAPDVDVIVLTYGYVTAMDATGIPNSERIYKRLIATHPAGVQVILDEWHHNGEESIQGDTIEKAFSVVADRLMLSGTPYRHKGDRMPWVRYADDGKTAPDFSYTLQEAITDGVVLAMQFQWLKGPAEFEIKGKTKLTRLGEELAATLEGATYRTIQNPWVGEFVRTALHNAHQELLEQQESYLPASGIIFAPTIEHAYEYAAMMTAITGDSVPVVHAVHPQYPADEDPREVIKRIKKRAKLGHQGRWIVCVQLISEGVDLPSTQVLVYLSRSLTQMAFTQMMGRGIRLTESDRDPVMFVPHLPKLRDIVSNVISEQLAGLAAIEEPGPDDGDDGGIHCGGGGASSTYRAINSGPMEFGDIMDSSGLVRAAGEDIEEARMMKEELGLHGSIVDIAEWNRARRLTDFPTVAPSSLPIERPDEPPVARAAAHARRLHKRVSQLGAQLVAKGLLSDVKNPYGIVYTELRKKAGCYSPKEPGQKKLVLEEGQLRDCDRVLDMWIEGGTPWG